MPDSLSPPTSLEDFAADPAAALDAAALAPLMIADGGSDAFVLMTAATFQALTMPPKPSLLAALQPDSDHALIELGPYLVPRRRDPL